MTIRRALELAALTAGHGMEHWTNTAFFLILPFITKEFSFSLTEVGLLITYRTLVAALFNLPAGAIVDSLGRRRLMLGLAIFVSSLAYFGLGFSNSYLMLQAAITIVGIANVFWHPPAVSSLADLFPERKGLGLSFHDFGATFGEGIAPIVIGMALLYLPWRSVAQLHLVPGLLIAVALWLLITDAKSNQPKRTLGREYLTSLLGMLRNRDQVALGLISGTRVMAQNIMVTFLPLYLVLGVGLASDVAGFYVALLTMPSIISGLIAGPVSDRIGRKPVIRFGLSVSSLMLISLGLTKSGLLFAGALVVLGLSLLSLRPVIMAYAVDLAPSGMRGTAIAMLFLINALMASIAPLAAGSLADFVKLQTNIETGLLSTFYLAAAVVLLGDILALLATRTPRPLQQQLT